MTTRMIEPPLHRPRRCSTCGAPSTAIIDGRCLTCRTDPADRPAPVPPPTYCGGCGQRLLITHADRTACERCRLDRKREINPTLPITIEPNRRTT